MGVLNVTPDSFFDGGRYSDAEAARARVDALLAAGADLIDIGGESSRPGAKPVPAREQLERIEPALRHAVARGALVSVDTSAPSVAERAFELGAELANDISCLAEPGLARVCAQRGKTLILMHSRGPMEKMAGYSAYPDDAYGPDVVATVLDEWRAKAELAARQGLPLGAIWLDPGLGFNKNARHSFELLRGLPRLATAAETLVVGASRKSFLAAPEPKPPEQRLAGSLAAALLAVERGARVLRVHDVAETHQALLVGHAIRHGLAREAAHV